MAEIPSWLEALLKDSAEERKFAREAMMAAAEDRKHAAESLRTAAELIALRPSHPTTGTSHHITTLKPDSFGYFNPTKIPDAEAAYRFIDAIQDGVTVYGETSTRAVLRRCIKGTIADNWYYGLSQEEKESLTASTTNWVTLLRRDFMPRAALLELEAQKEVFTYNQGRSASEYVTRKILLCKIAGITNENLQVEIIHKGLSQATELFAMLEMGVKDDGTNTVQDYKSKVRKLQDAALASYNSHKTTQYQKKPWSNYQPKDNPSTEQSAKTSSPTTTTRPPDKGKDKAGAPKTPKEGRKYPRSRKCKNFPTCGDGEHWDAECKMRNSNLPSKQTRAYYASADNDGWEERDEDSDAEEYYVNVMQAHFAYEYQKGLDKQEGFTGLEDAVPEITLERAAPLPPTKVTAQDMPFQCGNCNERFKLKRLLYRHLKATNHYTKYPKDALPPPTIITSTAIHSKDPEDRIQDCQFMTLNIAFSSDKAEVYEVVADTGIANSAIDAAFLQEKAPHAIIHNLTNPKIIRGIGGASEDVTKLATVPTYLIADGNRMAKLTITYHVFTSLPCNILLGNDVFLSEGAEIKFAQNHMTLSSCENIRVPIKVTTKEKASKIIARIATKAIIPPRSTFLLPIKLSRPLEPAQDYLFLSKQKAITSQACSAGIFRHDQKNVIYTNLNDYEVTVFKGTAVGSVSSINHTHKRKLWPEATQEVRAYLGFPTENIHTGIGGFLPKESITEQTRPRIIPVKSTEGRTPIEQTSYLPPPWLYEEYKPTHPFSLPEGITEPEPSTSTWNEVHISTSDLTQEQEDALRNLCKRHKLIFNEKMGCVREAQEDWLRVPVSPDLERTVKSRPPYPASKASKTAIDTQFNDNVAQGRMSKIDRPSPYSMQVFVVKHGNKERPVVDMRMLNELVPGDAYPLPRQEDILANISGMNFISALDITSAFYQRMIHPDDRYRTGIVTHRGYEMFTVSPMGYKRSVQHQQKLMDKAFTGLTWRFVSCFVDDICVYSRTFQEHIQHLDEVFRILANLGITLRAKKCFLGFHSLELLGYLVDRMGLTTTEAKTAALLNLPYPETLNKLEYFVGLTNWNRHLVPYYAQRIKPLSELKKTMLKLAPTGRGRKSYTARTPIPKDELLIAAFKDVRDAIGSRPKIFHFLHDRPLLVFLDASPEYGIGVGAYQQKDLNKTHENKTNLLPIMFISRELTPAEKNYWPTDMEMSGLVWTVKKMRPYLEQTKAIFYTDHEPSASIYKMTGLATTSLGKSNLRLQNWGIYLSQFRDHITVIYRKGSEMEVPDALSRSRYEASEREKALKEKARNLGKIPDTEEFEVTEAFHATMDSTSLLASSDWHASIRTAIQNDHYLKGIYDALSKSNNITDGYKILPMTCQYALNTESDHLFYVDPKDDRLRAVLPTMELQTQALSLAHEGHQGYARTYEKLSKLFFWKRMAKDVKVYVDRCPQCLINKPRHHKPYGYMEPIKSPSLPFNTITLDLITDLPPCNHPARASPNQPNQTGEVFDSIMTVTDKFSKAVHFIEGRKDWSAKAWASKFYDRVVTTWGYPSTLITDQDKRFMSKFWKEIFNRAGTRCITTTPWHPQGDGQSERTNQSLEVTLRFYVDGRQDDWARHLPTIQGIFNNSTSATTGRSPNEILYGMTLRCAVDLLSPTPFETKEAKEVAEYRDIIRKEAEDAIALSQKQMTKYHNTNHEEPDFSTGYAYISMKTGYTLPSIKKKKLAAQKMGPYKILETVGKGRALRLELPPNAKISNVISITNLEPGPRPKDDPYARDLVNIREPIEGAAPNPAQRGASTNPAPGLEIETLLDYRVFGRWKKPQYLVRWKGWTMEYDQWTDQADIPEEMIKHYEETAARKAGTEKA